MDSFGSQSSAPSPVAELIRAEGGRVTFAHFMKLALTHPTAGYYSRVDRLLRHGGDFSTAPSLSPFFNRTLARLLTELVDASVQAEGEAAPADRGARLFGVHDRPSVVELGGGEGQLAEALLRHWDADRPEWRGQVAYRIVEVGAGLRRTQEGAVERAAAEGWDIAWGADLAEACAGTTPTLVVGNEFLDAVPVHLLEVEGDALREAYVDAVPSGLELIWSSVSEAAAAEVSLLFGTLDPGSLSGLTEDRSIEVFPGLRDLLQDVARVMPRGSFVNLDYGEWFPGIASGGESWGLQGRSRRRTVRGYFKHQLVADPLSRAGHQDLTADVDFAAVDLHGRQHGFETVLFTTLGRFLRAGGAETELQALRSQGAEDLDALEADRQATVLRSFLDEEDLGGAFKLMVQVRE